MPQEKKHTRIGKVEKEITTTTKKEKKNSAAFNSQKKIETMYV
jgi:hypothetical protein